MYSEIKLKFKSTTSNLCTGDKTFCNIYDYDVYLNEWDFHEEQETLIGKGRILLYLMEYATSSIRKGEERYLDLFETFDENYHADIYDIFIEDDHIKDSWIMDIMNYGTGDNILVPAKLELLPEYRGKGYGMEITRLRRRYFSGCYGIEVLKAFPLQCQPAPSPYDRNEWRESMEYDKMEQDFAKAKRSLYKMYRAHGYTRYKDTEYFYAFPWRTQNTKNG